MAAITIYSDLGAPQIKSATVSTVSPSISREVMGLDAMILSFLSVQFLANFFTLLFHFHFVSFYKTTGILLRVH